VEPVSSTGLSTRTASVLAYSGWWITGLLIWYLERRDMVARFHAAQSVVAFGAIALLTVTLAVLSAAALSFLAAVFMPLAVLTVIVFLFGVALWVVSAWKAASGDDWRLPLAAPCAERLARASEPASA
jgi:uncharacterized membrane protein